MGKALNAYELDGGYWTSEDGLTLLAAWKRDGLSNEAISERMGISCTTLREWRKSCPEIEKALKRGKEIVDYMVENALLKAALGYTTKEITVTLGKKIMGGEAFQVLKETKVKEVGPNALACMAWLNNRKHEQWKRNRDKVAEFDQEDSNVTVTIIRAGNKGEDGVNEGVQIERKKRDSSPIIVTDEEAKKDDLDYWPDDFEE